MLRSIGLIAIFGLLPIGEAIYIWGCGSGGYVLAGIVALVAYAFYGPRLPTTDELRSQLIIPILLIVVWSIISALFWCPASEVAEAWRPIGFLIIMAFQLHMIFTFMTTKQSWVLAILVCVLATAYFLGGTMLGLTPWECLNHRGRLTVSIWEGRHLNENNVGNQAAAAFIFAFYLLFHYKHLLSKIIIFVLAVICFAILIASGSRGALIGLVLSILAFAIYYRRSVLTSRRKRRIVVLGGLAVLFLVFATSDGLNDLLSDTTMAQRFDSNELNRGVGGRFDVMANGMKYVFIEGNLLGKGGMGVFQSYSEHYNREFVVHCMPVAMLADLGIIGLLLYGLIFWQVYKSIKQMPWDNEKNLCFVLATFTLLVTFKGGGAYYAGWTWYMLGLITVISYRARINVSRRDSETLLHSSISKPPHFNVDSIRKKKTNLVRTDRI